MKTNKQLGEEFIKKNDIDIDVGLPSDGVKHFAEWLDEREGECKHKRSKPIWIGKNEALECENCGIKEKLYPWINRDNLEEPKKIEKIKMLNEGHVDNNDIISPTHTARIMNKERDKINEIINKLNE